MIMAKDKIQITVKQMSANTVNEQIRVFCDVFGGSVRENRWLIKHYENPLSKYDNVFGAFNGDKLIGINAFMPMEYVRNGKRIQVVQSCESAVDPKYRGCGVFTKIVRVAAHFYCEKGYDAMVGFPNANSFQGFIKMGWTHLLDLDLIRIFCKYAPFVREKLHVPTSRIFNLPSCIKFIGVRHRTNRRAGLSLCEISLKDYTSLPRCGKPKFMMAQSEKTLEWKLQNENCHFFSVVSGDEAVAKFMVVFKSNSPVCSQVISASDLSSDSDTFIAAYSLLLIRLRKSADAVFTTIPRVERVSKLFKDIGFKKNGAVAFIVLPISRDKALCEELVKKNTWYPEIFDFDTVMPLDR